MRNHTFLQLTDWPPRPSYHRLHTLASHPKAAFFAVTAGGFSSAGGAPAWLSQPGRRREIAISPSVK